MKKHALVHSGGGANGAWALGVMKYMIEVLGFDWDMVAGTSVGALNGVGMAMYPVGHAKEALANLLDIWKDVTPKGIYKGWFPGGTIGQIRGLLCKTALNNSKPERVFVSEHFDMDKVAASDRDLVIALWNLDTGELEYRDDQSCEILEGILASSAYPVFFEPIKIGKHWYSDGGVVEIVPLNAALHRGATEIDIIVCQPENLEPWDAEGKTTLDTMHRLLDGMTTEIANRDMIACTEKTDATIRVWQPPKNVGSGLNFDQDKVQSLIKMGYEYAEKRATELGLIPSNKS